jgi:CRISPR system Cascade subunit CasA
MTDSFNLTTAPWIPCEFLDGRQAELSTRDTLVEAHRLREIVDPSPLVVAVLHRHLLAVLHRSYDGPKTTAEWSAIGRTRRVDVTKVETYTESVRERMDLFHPSRPFAQVRGLIQQFPADPIDALALERSKWGLARELFQHRPTHFRASMAPAEAARALLAHQAFATGGLVKKPREPTSATAAPLVRAAMVLLRGRSLFQTLLSNLLVYDPEQNEPIVANRDDAPAWECESLPRLLPLKREPKRLPRGWLDLLTWLSRRVELVAEDDRVVGFVRCVGQGLAEESPLEPMVAYRRDEKRGLVSIGIDPKKAFWRNADALFGGPPGEGRFESPKTFARLSDPEVLDFLDRSMTYRVDVFGLSADQSRVDLVRGERMDAALGLFANADAHEAVTHVLQFAESAVRCLTGALYTFAKYVLPGAGSDGRDQKQERRRFVDSSGAAAATWTALGARFQVFLRDLASDMDSARRTFEDQTRHIVRERFRDALSGNMSDGRALKARAEAEDRLERGLAGLDWTESGVTQGGDSGEERDA